MDNGTSRHDDAMGAECRARPGKYLIFTLAGQEYGIGIHLVREITGMLRVTPLPGTPPHVKGVINLRGAVLPVVDLRARFAMPGTIHTERTCIIVLEVTGDAGSQRIGIIVDAVDDVIHFGRNDIAAVPRFGMAVDSGYILGIAISGDRVRTLLDIEATLTGDETFTGDGA